MLARRSCYLRIITVVPAQLDVPPQNNPNYASGIAKDVEVEFFRQDSITYVYAD